MLGTVHGMGQSVSAAFRTIGPVISGWWYGIGLDRGVVGAAWWGTAAVAAAGCVTAVWVYEGSGHEIFLEGEDESEDEMESEDLLGRSTVIERERETRASMEDLTWDRPEETGTSNVSSR